jgi:hypothetical protein
MLFNTTILRRELGRRENNGGDKLHQGAIYVFMELSQ